MPRGRAGYSTPSRFLPARIEHGRHPSVRPPEGRSEWGGAADRPRSAGPPSVAEQGRSSWSASLLKRSRNRRNLGTSVAAVDRDTITEVTIIQLEYAICNLVVRVVSHD